MGGIRPPNNYFLMYHRHRARLWWLWFVIATLAINGVLYVYFYQPKQLRWVQNVNTAQPQGAKAEGTQ